MKQEGLIAELARCFDTEPGATALLHKCDLDITSFRPFNAMKPVDWWDHICWEIDKGIKPGSDLERIVREAADAYPGNDKFKKYQQANSNPGNRLTHQSSPENTSIFLSYASSDRSAVDQLYDALRTAKPGIAVFQDHRSLRPGQDWLDILREKAGSATVLICWVTPDYVKSAFCNYEFGIADSQGATIVPVFIGAQMGKQVPAYLSRRQAITCDNPPDIDDLAAQVLTVLP